MAIARFRWVMSMIALLLVSQNLVVSAEQAVPVSMEALQCRIALMGPDRLREANRRRDPRRNCSCELLSNYDGIPRRTTFLDL